MTAAAASSVAFTIYASATDPQPVPETYTWDDLGNLLADVEHTDCAPCPGKDCPAKDGLAWSPVTLRPGTTRANESVVSVNALVLDLDHLDDDAAGRIPDELAGVRFILHSTHSHRPPADHCLRAVIALSRPVLRAEWPGFRARALALLNLDVDRSTKDPSRFYYLPSVAQGGEWIFRSFPGESVDVDAILAMDPPVPAPAPSAPVPVTDEVPEPVVDLGTLTQAVKDLRGKYRRAGDDERAGLLDRLLSGAPLAWPGQWKDAGIGEPPPGMLIGRDPAIHRVASMLATKLPAGTPDEAALALMLPSIRAMYLAPEGLDAWVDLARSNYVRMHESRVANDARRAASDALVKGQATAILNARTAKLTAPVPSGAAPAPAPAATSPGGSAPDPDAWFQRVRLRPAKDANSQPTMEACELNAFLILSNANDWRGRVRWNDVRHEIEVIDVPGAAPTPVDPCDRHLDVLPRAVADHLLEAYDIRLPESAVASTLLRVARGNLYDPILQYLQRAKAAWIADGSTTGRLEAFLPEICHARTVNASGESIREHVERVGAKWLISAAARGIRPGCKVDTVLILESFKQGLKKTSLFERLGGEFYTVARMDVEHKDSLMVLSRSWIVELAELSALRRSDDSASRAFFSTRTDLYRLPYARAVSEIPRRAVFGGTTNPTGDGYLSDTTGNRRYWPIEIGEAIDLPRVSRERDLIFGEAVVRAERALAALDAGEEPADEDRWWLDGEEAEEAEAQAADRMAEDAYQDLVLRAWLNLEPAQRPIEITTAEFMRRFLNFTTDRFDRRVEMRVSAALRHHGWTRSPSRLGGAKGTVWRASERLRTAAKVALQGNRPPISVVAAGGGA